MKNNFRIVFWLLLGSSVLLSIAGGLAKDPETRNIVFSISLALLISAIIQLIVFRIKPAAFKDKPKNQDQ